jgi:hypothetical protein
MPLAPGRVRDLSDEELKDITLVETIEEADGIHAESERTEVRQQPNGADWPMTGSLFHEIAD